MESHIKSEQTFKNRLNKFKIKLGGINTKVTEKKSQSPSLSDSPVKVRLRKTSLNLKSFNNIDLKS
jgi:hypothetical protein